MHGIILMMSILAQLIIVCTKHILVALGDPWPAYAYPLLIVAIIIVQMFSHSVVNKEKEK